MGRYRLSFLIAMAFILATLIAGIMDNVFMVDLFFIEFLVFIDISLIEAIIDVKKRREQ